MTEVVSLQQHGPIAVITLNSPPVNALGVPVIDGLHQLMQRAQADANTQAVVLIGAGRAFSGGADIREFGKPRPADKPTLPQLLEVMDRFTKPIIAAIHGVAMGGGLELALGCDYRIAAPGAQIGLPEVKLGLLPGAGGTQRLPRVTGVEKALAMITSGDPVPSDQAHQLGIVDEIVTGDLLQNALSFAQKVIDGKRGTRKLSQLAAKMPEGASGVAEYFAAAKARIAKEKRGFPAPLACAQCVEAAATLPFAQGVARERELFMGLMSGTESRALRYLFFAERQAQKIPDVPDDTVPREIKAAAVLGAGTMGGGIAMNFANAGIPVTVLETSQEALDRGLATCKKNYANTVAKGRLTPEAMDKRVALMKGTLSYDDLKHADIIVEAVFEEMLIKKEVFAKLDAVAKAGAILATNTSTLDVNEIASATKRPQDVIGTHFFSPANVMRLLEIVRGAKTAKDVIATTMQLAKRIKKTGVLVGVCDGFVGNRMIFPYATQAWFLVEEGALPQQVDGALQQWGMAMGPFAMNDLAGMDVSWRIRKGNPNRRREGQRYSHLADWICEQGRYGQKTSAGVFRYEAGNRTPIPDPEIEALIMKASKQAGITRRAISDQEIIERCIYALVNEGAKILEEGIALRASDIDIIYRDGYGFPAYRGGPMFYADTVGLKSVYEAVEKYHQAHGDFWKPAGLLKKLAQEGKRFTDA
jgi:3-hydroxyacyl-CoA dehydrogenase